MSAEPYWRDQLLQCETEYGRVIQDLRNEVERQQRRCRELMHEQAMQRATAAADVFNFCLQYVTETKQQQQLQQQPPGNPVTPNFAARAARNAESVPLQAMLNFLHEYSHGLMVMPENRRKRERNEAVLSPLHHRLHQRLLARNRATGREEEEALAMAGEESVALLHADNNCGNATAWHLSTSAVGTTAEATDEMVSAGEGARVQQRHMHPLVPLPSPAASPHASTGSGGGRPPVMAAAAFGLPELPLN